MHPSRRPASPALQRGLSLIESLASLTVMALSVGVVVPGLSQFTERRHLEGASAQLATDLRQARSLAVAHQAPVRVSVQAPGSDSCYVVHTGAAGSCTCTGAGTATCTAGAQALAVTGFAAGGPVRISSNSASMLFDADRGTVTPTGTLRVQSRSGQAIHQVVNIMGRVRACSPQAAVPGYPSC